MQNSFNSVKGTTNFWMLSCVSLLLYVTKEHSFEASMKRTLLSDLFFFNIKMHAAMLVLAKKKLPGSLMTQSPKLLSIRLQSLKYLKQ